MNAEDRLRNFIKSAGEAPRPTQAEWEAFISRAHRSRLVRRVVLAAAAAAVVVAGAIGGGALVWDRAAPPTQPVVPAPIPTPAPQECASAPNYRPDGTLGSVAFARGGEVHLVDLTSARDTILAEGATDLVAENVRMSPDGRWVAFGRGYVVPSGGGEVCAPLGEIQDARWTPSGELAGLGDGVIMVGAPGQEAREIALDDPGLAIEDLALDGSGRLAAARVTETGGEGLPGALWVIDLTGAEPPVEAFVPGAGVRVEVAGWDPSGQFILAWTPLDSASIEMDGAPLQAIPVSGGPEIRVAELMLPERDFLAWCGGTLLFADGENRFVSAGKRVAMASSPEWTSQPLPGQGRRSVYGPACSADGSTAAATATPDREEDRLGTLPRSLLAWTQVGTESVTATEIEAEPDFGYESLQVSADGARLLAVERELRPDGQSRLILMNPDGTDVQRVANLGAASLSGYGHYEWSDIIDWYQAP